MLTMATHYANRVGTAPGTSTLYVPNPTVADLRGAGLGVPIDTGGTGFYGADLGVPMDTGGTGFYGAQGLGLIMPPSWKTGRTTTPPGLPGTTVVELTTKGAAAGLMGPDLAGRAFAGGLGGFSIETHPWWSLLSMASAGLSTYHGYKRWNSIGAAIGWGLLGGFFPVITPAVAVAQGFGKRKK